MIDQTTLGHQFIHREFNYTVRVGWYASCPHAYLQETLHSQTHMHVPSKHALLHTRGTAHAPHYRI